MSFKYETITDPIFLKVAEHQGDKDFCWVTPESKAPLASDIKQHPCVITSRYKNHDTKIKEFEVRHDDVWVISYPKSGSTWCQEMIWLLMNNLNYERALNENIGQRFPFLEFGAVRDLPADIDPFKQANEMKSPRFIKSHLPVSLLPDQIWTVKPKLVYIRRNPKDVGVSYFHHSATLHDYGGPIEDFMDLFLADLALFSPYHSHVIEYHSLNNANILLLSFEDMKKDLALVIRDSMAFLNRSYSTDQIEELCKHLSFDSMKKNKAVNLEEWIKYCLSISKKTQVDVENAKFIRKGQVGGWKSELAPELSKRFDEWTMEKVKDDSLRKLFLNDI